VSTTKKSEQYFEEFKGEDLRSSHLTRSQAAAVSMVNLEPRENQSLMGRQGSKISSQPIYMRAIHTYRYIDEDGVAQEELLGIGSENFDTLGNVVGGTLYRLKRGSFNITYVSGSTSFDYEMESDVAAGAFKFKISQNGTVTVVSTLGTGYETTPATLSSLVAAIDALANFSATYPKTAVVNGNQAGVTTVTVDAGHTLSVGDWIPIYNRANSKYEWREVVATTATTISFPPIVNLTVDDNDIIGLGRLPAVTVELHQASESTVSPKPVYFTYWERVPCPVLDWYSQAYPAFYLLGVNPGSQNYLHPSFENERDCCYVTSSYARASSQVQLVGQRKLESTVVNQITEGLTVQPFKAGVWKYDGKDFYMSGLPLLKFETNVSEGITLNSTFGLAMSGGGGSVLSAGEYKYRHSLLYVDYQDNEIEVFDGSYMQDTAAAADSAALEVACVTQTITGYYDNLYNAKGAKVNGAHVAQTTITVDAGHTLRTGDTFFAVETSTENIQRRKVTSWTNTTITIDEALSVDDNADLGNILHRMWRTKANGNEFFLAMEVINLYNATTTTATDEVADADLGIEITSVEPEVLQYGLPPGNCLTSFQNILAVAGGAVIPRQAYWENADSPEFTNPGVFSDIVPSKSGGDIAAICADTDSALAAFKKTSLFRFAGSLPSSQYELEKSNDTGPGISGPRSFALVEELILGIGDIGIVACSGGKWSKGFGKGYDPYFIRNKFDTEQKLRPERAQVFHDEKKKRVLFFVPAETNHSTASPTGYSHNTNSKVIIWDYSNEEKGAVWYQFSYDIKRLPSAGFAYWEGKLYFANWMYDTVRSLWRGYTHVRLDNETSNIAQDYAENCDSYTYELKPQWDDAGEPKKEKTWNEMTVYMLQPDLFVAAFDVSFASYRDWDESKVDTQRTLSFGSSTNYEEDISFDKQYKARRRLFKFSGTINKNPPVITGYQYTLDDEVYRMDKLK